MRHQRILEQLGRQQTTLSAPLMVMAGLLMTMASLTANRWLVLGAGAVAGLLLVPLLQRPDVSPLQWQVQTIRRSRAGQPCESCWPGTTAANASSRR